MWQKLAFHYDFSLTAMSLTQPLTQALCISTQAPKYALFIDIIVIIYNNSIFVLLR